MNVTKLRRLDLNLLVVFDVIMKERSIASAAKRLQLSQSALSHALARFRKVMRDQLFIREGGAMWPTARAVALAPIVRQALDSIVSALEPAAFVPAHAARTFTIGASDYSCIVLVPRLVEAIAKAAPDIDLCVVPANRLDVIRQVDDGRVDLAIGWFGAVPARFGRITLFDEDYVFVVRTGHPLLSGELTPERALGFPHVVVDYTGNEEHLIDGFLAERGVLRRVHVEQAILAASRHPGRQPRIAVKVPTFGSVADLVARTDMVATLPRRLAGDAQGLHRVSALEPPFPIVPVAIEALWHWRTESDAGVVWLREQIKAVAASIAVDPRRRRGIASPPPR